MKVSVSQNIFGRISVVDLGKDDVLRVDRFIMRSSCSLNTYAKIQLSPLPFMTRYQIATTSLSAFGRFCVRFHITDLLYLTCSMGDSARFRQSAFVIVIEPG